MGSSYTSWHFDLGVDKHTLKKFFRLNVFVRVYFIKLRLLKHSNYTVIMLYVIIALSEQRTIVRYDNTAAYLCNFITRKLMLIYGT